MFLDAGRQCRGDGFADETAEVVLVAGQRDALEKGLGVGGAPVCWHGEEDLLVLVEGAVGFVESDGDELLREELEDFAVALDVDTKVVGVGVMPHPDGPVVWVGSKKGLESGGGCVCVKRSKHEDVQGLEVEAVKRGPALEADQSFGLEHGALGQERALRQRRLPVKNLTSVELGQGRGGQRGKRENGGQGALTKTRHVGSELDEGLRRDTD